MYYHENIPTSQIAAYFAVPTTRIDGVLARTVAFLRDEG
jgi:hypothetical protein